MGRIGMSTVKVSYFSDVLCVWAYVAQARVDELQRAFGADVHLDYRFCSVFGDVKAKIGVGWRDRGGFAGYNTHVMGVAERFPEIGVHPEVWLKVQPASSASPHLFLAALADIENGRGMPTSDRGSALYERVALAFRRGFFRDCLDIGRWDVQCAIAESLGVDIDAIEENLHEGRAFARLSADYQDADKMRIEGSPTFVLNEGRQKLYGNVGFRIIEANIKELLREPSGTQASWC